MNENPNISCVIPLFNEEESIKELFDWIDRVLKEHQFSYEVIFVDDGSTDNSWNIIQSLADKNTEIKAIKFRRNNGKSAGLNAGFEAAQGDVVITMDADLQDSPDEIPELYKMIQEEGFDLVSGWKKKRHDPISKTIPTKLYNWATRRVSGIYLHDFNCGLKAYKKEVIKSINVIGEMHRYIPVMAKTEGFKNIGEKVVQHRARPYGKSKFGMERFINGLLDLATVTFISRFGKKPMHLFGLLGTLMFILGFFISLWLGIDKLFIHKEARLIADNPLFYIALTSMILGTQLFLAGFIAELLVRNNDKKKHYKIEQTLN